MALRLIKHDILKANPMPTLTSSQEILQAPMIRRVQKLAQAQGGDAYLVGGAVRDWLLTGELPLDLDFTLINCKAAELAKTLADNANGHLVPLDWDFGIHRVVFDDGLCVDLADALENDLHTDLARRDLTINALAMDLTTGEIIDTCKGQDDLKSLTIRMVSEFNLLDDPLRMLRVFRMAASIQPKLRPSEVLQADVSRIDVPQARQLNDAVQFDEATLAVVREHGAKLWNAAAERITYELFRLLSVEHCFPALKAMADCRLLEVIIPELTPMRAIGSSGFHHLGLFDHTMELVRQSEILFAECPVKAQEWLKQAFTPAVTRFGLVKLACLLHDIGKPDTMGTREDPVHGTRLTFYGHEELGAEMADPLLRKLKVSNEVRAYLKKLVRWHLYPCQFGPKSPRKSVLKFYRRMGKDTFDVLLLALSDRHSACGDWLSAEDMEESHQAHLWLMANYEAETPTLQLPRLLNGGEIMQILNIGPGPHLKELLEALQEAQQLNEISTKAEAERWLKAHYAQPSTQE
jgi:putative nucleotidyltransferase with HDIG domain